MSPETVRLSFVFNVRVSNSDVALLGGGSICLGEFLHLALVGSSFGYA